jgi:hypothetical protein
MYERQREYHWINHYSLDKSSALPSNTVVMSILKCGFSLVFHNSESLLSI